MFGNEEDFNAALGYEIEGVGDAYDELDPSSYRAMLEQVVRDYPNPEGRGDEPAHRDVGDVQRLGRAVLRRWTDP
jgi:2-dehydro-3-deoxygluconokinase